MYQNTVYYVCFTIGCFELLVDFENFSHAPFGTKVVEIGQRGWAAFEINGCSKQPPLHFERTSEPIFIVLMIRTKVYCIDGRLHLNLEIPILKLGLQ